MKEDIAELRLMLQCNGDIDELLAGLEMQYDYSIVILIYKVHIYMNWHHKQLELTALKYSSIGKHPKQP